MAVYISKLNASHNDTEGWYDFVFPELWQDSFVKIFSVWRLGSNRFTCPAHHRTCRISQQLSANTSRADLIIQCIRFQEN